MKFNNATNPAHCASVDKTRYILNGVFVTGNLAVATNGRVLFASKIERDSDESKRDALIPIRAMNEARKSRAPKKRGCGMLPMLTIVETSEEKPTPFVEVMSKEMDVTKYRDIEPVGNFPNFAHVIPANGSIRLGLSFKLFAKIAKAFGTDDLTLHIQGDDQDCVKDAVIVTSRTNDAFAVIMPRRTEDDLHFNEALNAARANRRSTNPQPATTDEPGH